MTTRVLNRSWFDGTGLQRLLSKVPALDIASVDLTLCMTLLLLLFHVSPFWYVALPVTLLAVVGLLFRVVRAHANFWFALVVFLACGNLQNWYTIDNHKYLITYWCLAVFLALRSTSPRRTLAFAGRALIGLVFLFATLWKIQSPDFVDGRFFTYQLLADSRFETLATTLRAVPAPVPRAFRRQERELTRWDATATSVTLNPSPRLVLVARGLTVWTLLIEGLITLAFLSPAGRGFSRARHVLLLFFLFSTYISATVVGFGWVLAIMGLAQCRDRRIASIYFVAFLLILAYSGPWSDYFGEIMSS